MRSAALASGVLFALLSAAGPAGAQAPSSRSDPSDDASSRGRFRTSTDLVVLDVSVTDLHGKPVSGLGADDFVVVDGGVARRPTMFYEDGRLPLAVALLIDRSQSMSGSKLRSAVAAAAAFIDRLGPRDVFEVLAFNERVERSVGFGEDRRDAVARMATITADGQTALYDAVLVALHDLTSSPLERGADRRQVIIVLSDGEDNFSLSGLEDASEQAARRSVPLYGVSLRTDTKERPQPPPYTLTTLANVSGGRAAGVRSIDDLVPLYEAIADELRAQYRFGYEPPDGNADGRWHGVSVRLSGSPFRARTRTGYYAPRRPSAVQKDPP